MGNLCPLCEKEVIGYIQKEDNLMFKKMLKGLLTLAILAMFNSPAQAFYTDMDQNHWAYQSIKFLTEIGVVVGYPDGTDDR